MAFIAGTFALGQVHGLPEDHLDKAKELMVTFNEMYVKMPTGLSPEIAYFSTADNSKDDIVVKVIALLSARLQFHARILNVEFILQIMNNDTTRELALPNETIYMLETELHHQYV